MKKLFNPKVKTIDVLSKEDYRKKKTFEEKYYELMFNLGLENKSKDTFYLDLTKKTDYGWHGFIELYSGLSFGQIEKARQTINENLECIWIMQTKQFSKQAEVKIIDTACDPKIPFTNPEIKPWEVFIGNTLEWKPKKVDANRHCHFLIGGATGTGKTRGFACTITSWIIGCKPNDVELYIADLASDEFGIFKWTKHCRYYATKYEELYKMLNYVYHKMIKRLTVLSPLKEDGIAQNIKEYNETQKAKMSYVYVIIDEFSVLMPDKTDTPEDKEFKEKSLDLLKKLSKLARKQGIFLLIGLQKTTATEMPSIIKSQSGVRLCYRTNDPITSEVILNNQAALGLDPRYAVYSIDGGNQDYVYSPYIDIQQIKELIKPFVDKTHSKINLDSIVEAKVEDAKQKHISEKSTYSQKQKVENKYPNADMAYDSRKASGDYIDR